MFRSTGGVPRTARSRNHDIAVAHPPPVDPSPLCDAVAHGPNERPNSEFTT